MTVLVQVRRQTHSAGENWSWAWGQLLPSLKPCAHSLSSGVQTCPHEGLFSGCFSGSDSETRPCSRPDTSGQRTSEGDEAGHVGQIRTASRACRRPHGRVQVLDTVVFLKGVGCSELQSHGQARPGSCRAPRCSPDKAKGPPGQLTLCEEGE